MTRVLAAVGPGRSAPAVLRAAQTLAAVLDAGVAGIHVAESGADAGPAAAREAGVELDVTGGPLVAAVAAAAAAPDVAAVVIGAGEGAAPPGPTAAELLLAVATPVVVVPAGRTPPERVDRILAPLEGTAEGSAAIAATFAAAGRRGVDVVVLHIHTPETVPAFEDHAEHAAAAWEREFAARFAPSALRHLDVPRRTGGAAESVAEAAADLGADLVVLSWGRDLGPGRARVVRETLARSPVPVVLVPVS